MPFSPLRPQTVRDSAIFTFVPEVKGERESWTHGDARPGSQGSGRTPGSAAISDTGRPYPDTGTLISQFHDNRAEFPCPFIGLSSMDH